jgi:uncharacterized protein (TIGR03437 family)
MKLFIAFLMSSVGWAGIVPIWFEPNQGQANPAVEFLARTSGGYVYLGRNQMAVELKGRPVRMNLEGANEVAQATLEEPLGAISSYFSGQTEKDWHTRIPHYARVRYKDVYPGIDLVYYANGPDLEYDFRLQPNADPGLIQLAYNQSVSTDLNGDLLVGAVRQKRPRVIQNGREVACDYLVRDTHHVQLTLAHYDRSQALTVDPVLVFSTYLGGPGDDSADGIALDSSGYIYLAMTTQSPAAPVLDPFQQETIQAIQPAVFKFTPDGQKIVYFVILNSGGSDFAASLALDSNGSPILVGSTQSARFPLKNPVQSVLNSFYWTGFITKFAPDGGSLVYSTYFGGSYWDGMQQVAVDRQGNAYFAGWTESRDFLVKNAVQPRYGGDNDCFLGKLSPTGALLFSTYYGGSGREFCYGVSIAPDGGVLVSGGAGSSDYPFKNPIQTEFTDAFMGLTPMIFKLSSDGQTVIFATYFGGPTNGEAKGVQVDSLGNIYAAGGCGNYLTVKNAYQGTYPGAASAFLMKFDSAMQNLIYSTYFGGSSGYLTLAEALVVDSFGSAYIAGQASSADFPQKNSLQPFVGGGPDNVDVFVAKFDPSGSTLIFSTLLGGNGEEGVSGLVLDPKGNVYVTGFTYSTDFPIHNAFQPTVGGDGDGFLAEISDNTPISPSPITVSPGLLTFQFVQGGSSPNPQTVAVSGPSFTSTVSDSWIAVGDATGALSISLNPSALVPGTYSGMVTLTPQAGTAATISVSLTVLAAAPVLTTITPSLVQMGSNDTAVMLHGSGFTNQTTMLFDGSVWKETPVTFVNSTMLKVTFLKQNLTGQATFSLSVQNPQSAVSNPLPLTVGQLGPQFTAATVLNAASFAGGSVAPGEIVSIFGTNLVQSVSFDSIPATPVYFSPTQVNVTVPYQIAGQTTTQLLIGEFSVSAAPVTLNVAPSAPGIFAAVSVGQETLTIYATGCGLVSNDKLPLIQLPVSLTVNDQPAQVLYAGIAPGLVQGVDQINIQLQASAPSGPATIVLTVGGIASKPFTMTLP